MGLGLKVECKVFKHENVEYFKLSVYRLNRNFQTVYCFLLGDLLIDTAHSNSRPKIKEVFKDKLINQIAITHHHEDHTGNLAYLIHKKGARAYGHEQTVHLMKNGYRVSPLGLAISGRVRKAQLQVIKDGDVIENEQFSLRAIHTPGHTDDHMTYYEADKGYLFSGDLYVADRIKYFEKNESLKTQIESIKKLTALNFDVLFCSHNPKLKNGKERLERKLQLFEDLYGSVLKWHEKGQSTNEILKSLGRKENLFYKYMTAGHFTAENMVKSVLKDEGLS